MLNFNIDNERKALLPDGSMTTLEKFSLSQDGNELLIHIPAGGVESGANGTNGAHISSLSRQICETAERENMSCIDILCALEDVKRRLFNLV